ncbi:hypothetical protein D3C86_1933880 [compost metagenome]
MYQRDEALEVMLELSGEQVGFQACEKGGFVRVLFERMLRVARDEGDTGDFRFVRTEQQDIA